jgi:hypothetical protein
MMGDLDVCEAHVIIGSQAAKMTVWDFVAGKCGLFDWYLWYESTPEYADEIRING